MNARKENKANVENASLTDDGESSHLNVEDQIARSIVELLDDHAQHLTPAQEQHLLAARSMAVNQLANQQTLLADYRGAHQNGHTLQWFGSHIGQYFSQHRIFSATLVVGVMLLTFFAVQQFGLHHHLESSDAFLLASDLPPEAYADKGFNAWLDAN